MRRIYYTSPRRQKITQDALRELRRTRETIDPALLDRARSVIAARASAAQPAVKGQAVPVDREKNLETIVGFLKLTAHNKRLRKQVMDMLAQS